MDGSKISEPIPFAVFLNPRQQVFYIGFVKQLRAGVHGGCRAASHADLCHFAERFSFTERPHHACHHAIARANGAAFFGCGGGDVLEAVAGDEQGTLWAERHHHYFAFALVNNVECCVVHLIHFQIFDACERAEFGEVGFQQVQTLVGSSLQGRTGSVEDEPSIYFFCKGSHFFVVSFWQTWWQAAARHQIVGAYLGDNTEERVGIFFREFGARQGEAIL